MSPISLPLLLLIVAFVAAQPPLWDSPIIRLSASRDLPVTSEIESESESSSSSKESGEVDPVVRSRHLPLAQAPSYYTYSPHVKYPRHPTHQYPIPPSVIERPVHHNHKVSNSYSFCAIAVSGVPSPEPYAQKDIKPTLLSPKEDVELVFGNYCSRNAGGKKVVGMQVVACDLGRNKKPIVIAQRHNEDSVKFNHFDVYGTSGGVIVFAKQFCGNRIG